jgi:hypothetical protein
MKKLILFIMLLSTSLLTLHLFSSFKSDETHAADTVNIYDKGVNMKISSYTLPQGWKVDHQIATAINDPKRFFSTYKFDFLSSKGEVARNFAPIKFSPAFGQPLEKFWPQTMSQLLQPFGRFSSGQVSQAYYGTYLFPEAANIQGLQMIESYVSGTRNGKAFEGVCIGFLAYGQYTSQITGVIIVGPKGQFNATFETFQRIHRSKRENPQYKQRVNQINQRKIQSHQKVMRDRQAAFNRRQASYQELANAYSRDNAAFNEYLKGSSSSSSSSYGSYSTQDAYNDNIQSVTSFNDSYFGHRIKQNGHYDYWYTDGFGNYHGTNDAGFDPNSLQGNWSRAYPVNN